MEYEIYHHGIKGMKWGVRRYQNKDGTLTPAGKKRVKLSDRDAKHLSERTRRSKMSESQTVSELKNMSEKKLIELDEEIRTYSGDWYESKGISSGFKAAVKKHDTMVKKLKSYEDAKDEAFKKYHDKLDEATVNNLPKVDQIFIRKYDRVINNDNYSAAYKKAYNSPEVKKLYTEYESKQRALSSESGRLLGQYESELLSAVLKDLGYKDSPATRDAIRDIVIWD